MKQKDLLRQWLAVGIGCIAFGGSMSAATITQTCSIGATSVPYTETCGFQLFDPAGGTLTSVVLSLTGVGGNVVPEQTVTNSTTQTFTNSVATVALTLTGPGPDSIAVTDTSGPCAGTIVGPGTNKSCSPTAFSGLSAGPVTGTTADYIGTGLITPYIAVSGQITSASGVGGAGSAGDLFFGGTGAIGGFFTITYTYTPALLTPTFSKAFGQPSIAVGSSTTLTFTITNPNATSALTGLAFTDSLPAGLAVATPNGLTSTCGGTTTATAGGSSVSLSGGTVSASGTCTISVNVLGIAAGIQNNSTSTLTSNAPTAAAATASITVVLLTPTLSKAFGQPSIVVGSSTTLTFTITNPNASGLTSAAFTDTLPSGLAVATPNGLTSTCGGTTTATAGGSSISLSGGTVSASSSCTISVNVLGITAGTQNNTTSTLTSNDPTAGAATASIDVLNVTAPTFSKAFGQPSIIVGSSTTLTFTITNPDASGLTSVAFTDTLPSGLAVATPNGLTSTCGGTTTATAGGSSISLSGGTVSASSSCTISVNVLGIAAGIQNNTTSTLTSNDPTAGAATASINVLTPAIIVPVFSKAFGQPSIFMGGSTTLTFTITNLITTEGLTGVAFTDTLPGGLVVATPNGLTSTCGGTTTATEGGSSISLSGGTVPAGGTCTISVNVLAIAAGTQNNTTSTLTSNAPTAPPATASIFVFLALDPPFQVSYAANPGAGESIINMINDGANGAALLGPGFGAAGNTCVNVYAFDPGEELIACCSCLLTPDQVMNLGVNADLTIKTQTGVVPSSVTIKLLNTLAGPTGTATSCTNSAGLAGTAAFPIVPGLVAYGTTPQAAGTTYNMVEHPFIPATLSADELASIVGRCASIIGNASGYGICLQCRSGALGAGKQ